MRNYRKDESYFKSNKGSLTVEAAIVLPLFICVVLTITTFIKIYQTHEKIQFALDETSESFAEVQYASFVLQTLVLNQAIENIVTNANPEVESTIQGLFSRFVQGPILDFSQGMLNSISDGSIEQHLKEVIIAKIAGEKKDSNAAVERLFIVDGISGLNVSVTPVLQFNDVMDITVDYRIKIPLPIQLLGEIPIIHRVRKRIWLGGGAFEVPPAE